MRDLRQIDPELAALVRERLDARDARLPAHFVPRPERPRRYRTVAAVVVAFLLGVGVALLIRPDLGSTMLSGVLGRPPAVTPAPAPPASPPRAAPGAGPTPSASGSPTPSPGPSSTSSPAGGGTPAQGATPAPTSSSPGVTIQVSLPPVLPTPTARPSPTPTCLLPLPLICVKT